MRKFSVLVVLLFSAFVGFAQQDLRNLAYGKERQQNLDLFLPKKIDAKTPVLLLLHGGAWSLGGKEFTDKTARDLRDRGFVVANVDYRYVSENVHAKDLLDDIGNAEKYMREVASKYGFASKGYHFSGISAGAHLAMLYSYTRNSGVKSIAVLCGPTQFDTEENKAHIAKFQLSDVVEKLADSKYGDGKPGRKFTEISPYAQIKNIPTLLFHGDKDDLVLYSQATLMRDKLKQAKVPSQLITMQGKGHDCGMNQADSEKVVLDNIENWIVKYN
ncbi:alpha/beta hydrolase [Flavobacterium sp.]|uniref:alpha/beta hydrolase n=1 Tax=Flavobacterium sp. TaxID=239 RepID=UPI0011F6073D|nr:alpha/beta hydrolase [Flavobacterium sp.]RZJ72260.1 MAG: alpha/beta hydrolase [Flavobacterium sp.]